jgi:hypothetical protein
MNIKIAARTTRRRLALVTIGFAFGVVDSAAAKASFWDLFDRDPNGIAEFHMPIEKT